MINIIKIIEYITINRLGDIVTNTSFKDLTTIKIGGIIKYLYYPNDIDNFILVFKKILEEKIKYFIIGNGSNILVSDEEYDGIVISFKRIRYYQVINNLLYITAGATYKDLIKLVKKGYGNIEEFAVIPGSIGGMIYQNASFNNKAIKDIVEKIECIDLNGNKKVISVDEASFGYRTSIFKNKELIITGAYFKVNNEGSFNKIIRYYNYKKNNQPLNKKTFGCTFKNTETEPVWKIIKSLKVNNVNDACISIKHANFLYNKNNASFADMYLLINTIKDEAIKLGYNLDLEIEIINR